MARLGKWAPFRAWCSCGFKKKKKICFYLMWVGICPHVCQCGVASSSPELELQTVVSCHVGTGHWSWVFWQSSQYLNCWAISPVCLSFTLTDSVCVCMCACVCHKACPNIHVEVENNGQTSVLPFHCAGSGAQISIITCGSKALYPLNHSLALNDTVKSF